MKCAATSEEFKTLKFKLKKIAQVSQKLFTITMVNDKLEKEKYSESIKDEINKAEKV